MSLIRRLILAVALLAGIAPAIAQVPAPVPALPDTERRTSYSISGTTCACNVNFALFGDSTDFNNWVEVFLNGTRVNFNDPVFGWTITSPSGPIANLSRPISNAILTFNAAQTGTVQIVGARRPRRTSQVSQGAGVAARDFNLAITDLVAQNRELWDKTNDMTGRGLFGLPGETLGLLPAAATRANNYLVFDGSGNPAVGTSTPSGSVLIAGPGISVTGGGPFTVSASLTAGPGISFTGTNPINISLAGATCVVGPTGQYSTIQAALTACPSSSTILVSTNQTVSTSITVAGAGVRITCSPGVVITVNLAIRFNMNGAQAEIDHCNFNGPGAALLNGLQLAIFAADYASFHDNIVTNFGATGAATSTQGQVEWTSGNHGKAYNNSFTSVGDISISVQPFATSPNDFEFYNNRLSGFLISPTGGNTVSNVRAYGNYLNAGEWTGNQSLCAFFSLVVNLSFIGNTCDLQANIPAATGGIYSFASVTNGAISGNLLRNNGFTYEDYSFEFNGMLNGRISDNKGEATATHGQGMICESCNGVSFAGNIQRGWKTGFSGFFFAETNLAFATMGALSIANNTLIADIAATNILGINVSNASGGRTNTDISISNNVIAGVTTPAGTIGIKADATGGAMADLLIGPNTIRSIGTGITIGTNVSNFCVLTGANYATTATAGIGANACH